jgi:hypothetical protein
MKKPDPLTRKLFERTMLNQANPSVGRLKPKTATTGKDQENRINCRVCEFFYVAWQPATPYGCKAHGFKSAQIPSMVVFSSSGENCLLYRPKPEAAK